MSYRRGRLSQPLRRLHTRAPCFPDCPSSLTSHRTGASLHLSVDRFSLGHLCLVSPARRLLSGPSSSLFFGCFRQLAVSFSQNAIQPYYFQFSLGRVVYPFGVSLIASILSEALVGRIVWQHRILAVSPRNWFFGSVASSRNISRVSSSTWVLI